MSALTSLLVRDGVVPVRKIEQALQRQVMSGGDLETVLLEMDAVPENVLSGYRAAVLEVPAATREEIMSVEGDVLGLVPADVAIEQRLVPLRVEGRTLHVAVHEPLTGDDLERLGFLLGYEVVSHVACEVRIAAALAHHYGAELPPRMVRLVGKMHGRESGELPNVGRVVARLSGHLADIPDKNLPAEVDDGYRRPRYTRSGSILLEPAPPEDEATGPSSEPETSRRHTIPAPALGTDETGDGPGSEPPNIAALRRHHGPITLAAGERMLRQSTDRDQILAVFFAFARQFFDYTALFVVHDNVADGREAWGVGAPTEEMRAVSIRIDKPGVFAEVCRTLAPQVRRIEQTEADRDVAVGLRRVGSPPAMVMPIAIRQRPVLVLYGDRDGEEFDIGSAMELVRFGPRVVEAFEQLIIRKKRAGYAAGSDAEPKRRDEDRDALKAAARDAARRTAAVAPGKGLPSKPPPDRTSWLPGKRRTSPGFMPDTSTSDDSWRAVRVAPEPVRADLEAAAPTTDRPASRAPKLSEPFAKEAKTDPSMPPVVDAEEVAPRRRRSPRRPPSQVLGIPRSAPPPPPSDNVEIGTPGLDDEEDEDFDLLYGDDDDYEVEMSIDADDDDEPEVVIVADDDEPEVEIDMGDDEPDLLIQTDGPDAGEDEPELEHDEDQRDTDPPPRPLSAYSVQGGPVDVVSVTNKRTVQRAAAAAGRVDKKTPDERPSPVRRKAVEPLPPPSDPPTGLDADSRSVIVDMGQQVHEQVAALLSAQSATEQQRLCEELTTLGEAALPVLAQSFPGPLAWQREQRGRVPPASEISPIMRAMVTFGPRAASYVAALLSSAHPDVRFYAAVVASEIVSPELMDAVAERIHDDDKAVRRIAVQLLPRFASFRGFAEIRTVVRRTARIRGKDLSRREHAIDAVAELRDTEMVPKLIELLREPDDSLVKHVHRALVKIGCIDLGRSHKKWQAWWDKNRSRHRVEWLIDSLVTADEPLRRQAGDELKRITQEYYGYHAGSPKRDRELIAKKYRQWWLTEGQRKFA